MRPVGHDAACEALEDHLPPATLLWGPQGIGKGALVQHLIGFHGYSPHDIVGGNRSMDMEGARDVLAATRTRPVGAAGRLVIAALDGTSPAAVNALLKVVEEPPKRTKFMFIATNPPLLTIRSRCHVHRLGLLSTVQLAEVLQERMGYEEHRAYKVAQMGRGSVSGALKAERAEGSKGVVISALRGVAEDDSELISNALRTFDDDGLWLLRTWVREARTGRWAMYSKSDAFGLESDVRNLDIVMGMLNRAGRPRLAATLALDGWRRERGRH